MKNQMREPGEKKKKTKSKDSVITLRQNKVTSEMRHR